MYACLSCGFIHNGKNIQRERIDEDKPCKHFASPGCKFHGYITYRICPECKNKQQLYVEKD